MAIGGKAGNRLASFGLPLILALCLLLLGSADQTSHGQSNTLDYQPVSEPEIYQAFQSMFDEIRFSRRVLLPAPGKSTDFIMVENVRGEIVAYVTSGSGKFQRVVIAHDGEILSQDRWLSGVHEAQFTAGEEIWSGRGAEIVGLRIEADCFRNGKPAGTVDLDTTVRVTNVSEDWMF
jgi:hypothetical protein